VPFTVRWTPEALTTYNQLQAEAQASLQNRQKNNKAKHTKAEGLFKQMRKCVALLTNNPRHPGLQTHPYSSIANPYDPKQKVFEAYAQNQTPGAYRVFWCCGPGNGELTIIAVTPHP
jgi:hypothetical protein